MSSRKLKWSEQPVNLQIGLSRPISAIGNPSLVFPPGTYAVGMSYAPEASEGLESGGDTWLELEDPASGTKGWVRSLECEFIQPN